MRVSSQDWEVEAAAKRADTLNKIPSKWRLSPTDVSKAEKQRDLTGSFVHQFLDVVEISIISKDTIQLIEEMKEGKLTAIQVTSAFCKAAAISHQIVSQIFSAVCCGSTNTLHVVE